MKKLLGILVACVIAIGVLPMTFAEIPSLKNQIEEEIPTEEFQCRNIDHVFVLRTSGKMACVTERTAEKLGWEIIKMNFDWNEILKEFPVEWSDESLTNEPKLVTVTPKDIPNISGIELHRPQPYSSVTFPENFVVGEEFDVVINWQWFDVKDKEGLKVDYVSVPDYYPGTEIRLSTTISNSVLSDAGFDVELLEGRVTTNVYTKTFDYHPTEIFSETFTIKVDEIATWPDGNGIGIKIAEIRYPIYIDATEQSSNMMTASITKSIEIYPEIVIDGETYEMVNLDGRDYLLKDHRYYEDIDGELYLTTPARFAQFVGKSTTPTPQTNPSDIREEYWDLILEVIQNNYPDLSVEEGLRVENFTDDFIERFLEKYADQLETQSFQLALNSGDIGQEERYIKYPANLDVKISNLPKIGETAELQFTVTNRGSDITIEDTTQENLKLYLIIGNNFEFVNQTDVITSEDEYGISKSFDTLASGESVILSATIKAVSEGFSSIRISALDSYGIFEEIHVGGKETLLEADYLKKYPQIQSVTSKPIMEMCGEVRCEPEPLPEDEYVHKGKSTTTSRAFTDIPEDELRIYLKQFDLSDEEIEEIIREVIKGNEYY